MLTWKEGTLSCGYEHYVWYTGVVLGNVPHVYYICNIFVIHMWCV